MADKADTRGKFVLHLPIDASENPDIKAGHLIKVLVRDGANASAQQVALDAKGAGVARFGFERKPGLLQVVVGPADATNDELEGLQTIRAEVPARAWARDAAELKHPALRIAPFYWH